MKIIRKLNVFLFVLSLITTFTFSVLDVVNGNTHDNPSSHSHVYDIVKSDDSKHWEECSCGEYKNISFHSYTDKSDNENHWQECSCGYQINVTAHNYTFEHDDFYHWEECSCGKKINQEAHVSNKGICSMCDYVSYSNGVRYAISSDKTYAEVDNYFGSETFIRIAPTYQGLPVTSIGYSAFENCDSLTEIVIPDSVTSIGERAFNNCDSLTEIVIPNSVTSIDKYAFYSCNSLTGIVIPDSVTSIDKYAFCMCDSLTGITFKDTSTWYRTDDYNNWKNKTGGTQVDVTNASTNPRNFNVYYNHSYWYKL